MSYPTPLLEQPPMNEPASRQAVRALALDARGEVAHSGSSGVLVCLSDHHLLSFCVLSSNCCCVLARAHTCSHRSANQEAKNAFWRFLWGSCGPQISAGRQRPIPQGLVLEAQNLCYVVNSTTSIANRRRVSSSSSRFSTCRFQRLE